MLFSEVDTIKIPHGWAGGFSAGYWTNLEKVKDWIRVSGGVGFNTNSTTTQKYIVTACDLATSVRLPSIDLSFFVSPFDRSWKPEDIYLPDSDTKWITVFDDLNTKLARLAEPLVLAVVKHGLTYLRPHVMIDIECFKHWDNMPVATRNPDKIYHNERLTSIYNKIKATVGDFFTGCTQYWYGAMDRKDTKSGYQDVNYFVPGSNFYNIANPSCYCGSDVLKSINRTNNVMQTYPKVKLAPNWSPAGEFLASGFKNENDLILDPARPIRYSSCEVQFGGWLAGLYQSGKIDRLFTWPTPSTSICPENVFTDRWLRMAHAVNLSLT